MLGGLGRRAVALLRGAVVRRLEDRRLLVHRVRLREELGESIALCQCGTVSGLNAERVAQCTPAPGRGCCLDEKKSRCECNDFGDEDNAEALHVGPPTHTIPT